jgi:hypothetical protein
VRIVHYYETQLADADHGFMVQFLIFPGRSFRSFPESFDEVLTSLDLTRLVDVASPAFLSSALAATLRSETASAARQAFNELIGARYRSFPEREPTPEADRISAMLEFSDASVFREFLPFEMSPLRAESMAGLFAKWAGSGAGTGIGASAAIVAYSTHTPLLILFIPAGIILCGAAKGVAKALEEGLRRKILQMFGVTDEMPEKNEGELANERRKLPEGPSALAGQDFALINIFVRRLLEF